MPVEPFENLFDEEVEEISVPGCGYLRVPKYGCATVAEEKEFRKLYSSIDREKLEANDIEVDLDFKVDICTIVLRSRIDPNWTKEQTLAHRWEFSNGEKVRAGMPLLERLFNFWLVQEHNQGKVIETDDSSSPPQKKTSTGAKSTGS